MSPHFNFTAEEQRELDRLPKLDALPDDRLISCTAKQVSLMSTVPQGSIGFYISEGKLIPAIPHSMVFTVAQLKQFCAEHRMKSAMKLLMSANAEADAARDAFAAALVATLPAKFLNRFK
jgi:hypothetical protein